MQACILTAVHIDSALQAKGQCSWCSSNAHSNTEVCCRCGCAGVTVSAETTAQWGGFVCLIVFAYLEKRWAWYNLERLQLEILVSSGRAMPPAAVAELAQLVYTTLHQVAPQWPSK